MSKVQTSRWAFAKAAVERHLRAIVAKRRAANFCGTNDPPSHFNKPNVYVLF